MGTPKVTVSAINVKLGTNVNLWITVRVNNHTAEISAVFLMFDTGCTIVYYTGRLIKNI